MRADQSRILLPVRPPEQLLSTLQAQPRKGTVDCRAFLREACQRGSWSSWTGLTLQSSWRHHRQASSHVVLAGRALSVPRLGSQSGRDRPERLGQPRANVGIICLAQPPFLVEHSRPRPPADSLSHRRGHGAAAWSSPLTLPTSRGAGEAPQPSRKRLSCCRNDR
jgi:hypothetical protein